MLSDPGLVGPALDVADPLLVFQIPLYCLANTRFEGLLRLPIQFAAHLAGIDGITAVVARSVGHIGDLIAIGARLRHHLVEQIADGMNDVQILFLVVTANVVGLADHSCGDHGIECTRMILNIEPIADLVALAINRQRLAIQRIEDDQRDQLFGEMIGAVVVGAVGNDGRQAISTAPGSHQMVAGGLGGRIGAAGGVRGGFSKEWQWLTSGDFIRMGQIPIHLVGGDVVEAESRLARLVQTVPIGACCFQQHIGADDIGLDEVGGARDGAINVTLGGQMHYGIGLVGNEDPIQFGAVANVNLFKRIAVASRDSRQGFQVARIGQLIEVDY